jgi:hypothetical protein
LFESLEQAKDKNSLKRYAVFLKGTGLRDQRLRGWMTAK